MKHALLSLLLLFTGAEMTGQVNFTETFFEYEDDELDLVNEIVAADVNGDEIPDFIVTSYGQNTISVGINNNADKPVFTVIQNQYDVRNIYLVDFDGDDDLDIIGSAVFDDFGIIWANDGNGNFSQLTIPLVDYDAIHFVDLNDDGIDEMVFNEGSELKIFENDNGAFSLYATLIDDVFAGGIGDIQSLDYNNDGIMDVAAVFNSDGVKIFQQSSPGDFEQIDITPASFNNESLFPADLNGDMTIDFMLHNSFSSRTTLLISNSMGEYEETILPEDNGSNFFSAFGDVDSDGDADILYVEEQSSFSGTISIWVNESGTFEPQILTDELGPPDWGGLSDLDNDGDVDLYMYTNSFANSGLIIFYNEAPVDADGDGFFSDVDCDDNNINVNPGEEEVPYNGLDDDCDMSTPDDDLDGDGFLLAEDCDDGNANINPGEEEIPYNGLDDDCDMLTPDDDLDGDGFLLAEDCDDENASINPDGIEIPNNGIDEDCDGEDLTVGTYQINNSLLKIFPNPASEIIFIEIENEVDFLVNIYDLSGKTIYSGENAKEIKIDNYVSGNYLLEIIDNASGQRITEIIQIDR